MIRNTFFSMELPYEDGLVRVEGSISPYFPATGPSMESAGGDPAEGGEIEDFKAWKIIGGVKVETEETDEILKSLEDKIRETVAEDMDDGPDPDAARDAKMAGD